MAEVLRHLGIAAHAAGQLDQARQRLEESTTLRRETGQLPGAAANMVGLAYIAAAQGRGGDARALLDEAAALATDSGAQPHPRTGQRGARGAASRRPSATPAGEGI